MRLKFRLSAETAFLSLQFPHLRRSPEYFSTATSLGRGGIEEGLGFPADAAGAGLLWEGGGERIVSVTLLVLSTGWKELPNFISTSGPLSSDEKAVKKNTLESSLPMIDVNGWRKEKSYLVMCWVWDGELPWVCV